MAEVAAGAVVAEQVVSTSVQAGAAGFAIGKATMPLTASFERIIQADGDSSSTSLARSDHTFTVLGHRAYLFGGKTGENMVATNEMHSFTLSSPDGGEPEYNLAPAIPLGDGGRVPEPRMGHSACAFNKAIAVYGGTDGAGNLLDDPCIWLFEPTKSVWHAMEATATAQGPPPRGGAKMFAVGDVLILYGGKGQGGAPLSDVWRFDVATKSWSQLPDAPISTTNAAMAGNSLYLIGGSDALSGSFYYLNTAPSTKEEPAWEEVAFPTNPLTPGPRPRENGGLLHVSTGYGRNYLLYFFGERQSPAAPSLMTLSEEATGLTHWSDMWTFQLPSNDLQLKPATSLAEAIQPAKIKDAIRAKIGGEDSSGTHTWAEVQLKTPGDIQGHGGKVHPGPRSCFGYDVLESGKSVVVWGGRNAKGEREGDGWIIQLE